MAEKTQVKSADDMDVETFLKHINARHTPIGKMKVMGRSNIPGDENESLLRAYHDKVHETFDDTAEDSNSLYSKETRPNHTHVPPRKESS